jgi:hypothetical protein
MALIDIQKIVHSVETTHEDLCEVRCQIKEIEPDGKELCDLEKREKLLVAVKRSQLGFLLHMLDEYRAYLKAEFDEPGEDAHDDGNRSRAESV